MELLFSHFIKYILLLVKAIRMTERNGYTIITVSKIRIRLKINSALYIEALGIHRQ